MQELLTRAGVSEEGSKELLIFASTSDYVFFTCIYDLNELVISHSVIVATSSLYQVFPAMSVRADHRMCCPLVSCAANLH